MSTQPKCGVREPAFVSVVIPAYNASQFICEALDSVLGQTHRNFEVVVSDDGSTDGTLEILRRYEAADDRVCVLTHENWGIGPTLNHAIDNARSNWIIRMDADDVMEPNRLERQLAFVGEHPDVAVTASLVTHIDDKGLEIGKSAPHFITDEEVVDARSRGEVIGFHHPAVLMRKDVVNAVGGYRQEFWPAEDMDLWNRIIYAGYRVLVQPEYLLRYRIHSGATSTRTRHYRENIRWIHSCIAYRQCGLPEPTRQEFLDDASNLPKLERWNRSRADLAWVYYRNATFSFSSKRWFHAARELAVATMLGPEHVFPKVWEKLAPGWIRGLSG